MLKWKNHFRALLVIGTSVTFVWPITGHGEEQVWYHGTSLEGDVKYAADFERFDYVNPDAPKGGRVREFAIGTFDSLNFVAQKGDAVSGIGLIYDNLMTSSMDETSSQYGLLADMITYPSDYSYVTFRLRPEAKWHDGKPLTADDVVFSFKAQTEFNPNIAHYYSNVDRVVKNSDHEVTFHFKEKDNRELPHILGQLTVLPKHYWESEGKDGAPRDISKSTLESPLGSGPYKIKSVDAGRSITYERVPDYWGRNLPVRIGQNNFDTYSIEYFKDETAAMVGFTADEYDWRVETTAKVWATGYDFPAVKSEAVIKELFETRGSGVMLGFVPNLRREKYQDVRVRRALNYLFDYESMNEDLFYGQYERISSYFFGTELASKGLPAGRELEILKEIEDEVPPEVFTETYTNPLTNASNRRSNLREALGLFKDAGWSLKSGKMINDKSGEQFTIEFLTRGGAFERVALRLKENFEVAGIKFDVRIVDDSQYTERARTRDFDMIYTGWGQSTSPGNEQLYFFGSEAADQENSRNYAGIKNPVIDKLIQRIIYAKDRDELIATVKAMDRVLLWNNYVVPGWTLNKARVARWDRFSHPENLPMYVPTGGFPTIWWWDEEKAKSVEIKKGG